MKNEFYKWYKQRFEKLAEEPPAEVWETITQTLNKNAAQSLPKAKRMHLVLPSLFLLMGLSGTYFFSHHADKETILTSGERSRSQIAVKTSKVFKTFEVSNTSENISAENLPTPHPESVSSVKSKDADGITETATKTTRLEKYEVKSEQIPITIGTDDSLNAVSNPSADNTISHLAGGHPLGDIQPIETTQLLDNLTTHILPTGFYFGNAFTLNNSWLLNNDTKNGLNKNSLDDVNLYFGSSYALLSGYNFSDRFSVQAEWMLYNKQGQKYIDYDEGHQTTRDELLNYTQFNFVVKKKTTRMAFKGTMPLSFCTLAGMHYSILTSAKDIINGETIPDEDNYKNNNYGVILGFGYEALLMNHWLVSTSLRMDVGLRNIYEGSPAMPSYFNRTYNSSVGLQAGIAYLFTKTN